MDLYHKLLAGVVALCLVGGVGLAGSYIGAREDRIKMQATIDAQKNIIDTIEQREKQRAAEMQDFLKSQQSQLDNINKRFDQARSPQDITSLVSQLMALQKPITFVTPPATADNPHPQPVAQVPAEDAPQVKAYVQGCEQCKLNLQTANQKLTYADQTHTDDQAKITAANKERDAAIQAAKGGSTWQRFKRGSKWFAIGSAAGAAATAILKH